SRLVDDTLSTDAAVDLRAAQDTLANWMRREIYQEPIAVGHRIVHGGPFFERSVLIDDEVLDKLGELVPLAPLHQENNLAPVRVIREHWPGIRQVACFDT